MPNLANAKKALRQSFKRAERNKLVKENYVYAVRMVRKAIAEANKTEAANWFQKAQKTLDKAVQKNIIKANKSSRLKSRLNNQLNKLK